MQTIPAFRLSGQQPPFRLFDLESADACGETEAGYFDARTLYGDDRADEDGTIATLAEAVQLREQMARMYGRHHKNFEIRDATGTAICEQYILGEIMWRIDVLTSRLDPDAEARLWTDVAAATVAGMADNILAAQRGMHPAA